MTIHVIGYEGLYFVTDSGKVFNKEGKEISQILNKKRGYLYCMLYKNGKRRNLQVHRIVATSFIKNIFGKPQVNHKDMNKLNNSVSNLEWCTSKENHRHAINNGKRSKPKGNRKYGDDTIDKIKDLRKGGFLLKEISNRLNIPVSTVTHICLGSRRS